MIWWIPEKNFKIQPLPIWVAIEVHGIPTNVETMSLHLTCSCCSSTHNTITLTRGYRYNFPCKYRFLFLEVKKVYFWIFNSFSQPFQLPLFILKGSGGLHLGSHSLTLHAVWSDVMTLFTKTQLCCCTHRLKSLLYITSSTVRRTAVVVILLWVHSDSILSNVREVRGIPRNTRASAPTMRVRLMRVQVRRAWHVLRLL